MFLIAILWLVACSPLSGSDRTQPALSFQQDNDLTSLASNSPTSTEDKDAASIISFSGILHDEAVTNFGKSLANSQDLFGSQNSRVADVQVPVDVTSAALLQEIYNIVTQRQADLVPSTPGWLHLITRRTNLKVNSLFIGDKSGGQIQQEQWLLLDSHGVVRADIRRTLSSQEPEGGFSLWESGEWINTHLATTDTVSSKLPYDPNYEIYNLFDKFVRLGYVLNKSIIYKECWYQGEKYTVSNGQIMHEVLFRPDYHSLRWIKTWDLSSGAIILVDSLEIALEERIPQPPDEILNVAGQLVP